MCSFTCHSKECHVHEERKPCLHQASSWTTWSTALTHAGTTKDTGTGHWCPWNHYRVPHLPSQHHYTFIRRLR